MEKILIVEDTQVIREEICDILQMENFEVIMASNGYEGLIQTKNEKPDLIISDIMMPGLNGYQLVNEIRKSPETEKIPVIFLSAKAQLSDIRAGMNLGVDDYITKPIRPDDLLTAVNTSLEKHEKLNKKINELRIKPIELLPQEIAESIAVVVGFSQYLSTERVAIPTDEIELLINGIYDNGEKINKLINDYLFYLNLITQLAQTKKSNINTTELNSKVYIKSIILFIARDLQRIEDIDFNLLETILIFDEFYFRKIIEEMFCCAIQLSVPGDKIKVWSVAEKGFYKLTIEKKQQKNRNNNNKNTDTEKVNASFKRSLEIVNLITKNNSGKFEYAYNKNEGFYFTYYFQLQNIF